MHPSYKALQGTILQQFIQQQEPAVEKHMDYVSSFPEILNILGKKEQLNTYS